MGRKLVEARKVGYPYIIVVGKKSVEPIPKFELHDLNKNVQYDFDAVQIFNYFKSVR